MFKKFMPVVVLAPPTAEYDSRIVVSREVIDGVVINRAIFELFEVTDPEYLIKFPNPLECTLENQLNSGEIMNEHSAPILNVSDAAHLDAISVGFTNSVINKLNLSNK